MVYHFYLGAWELTSRTLTILKRRNGSPVCTLRCSLLVRENGQRLLKTTLISSVSVDTLCTLYALITCFLLSLMLVLRTSPTVTYLVSASLLVSAMRLTWGLSYRRGLPLIFSHVWKSCVLVYMARRAWWTANTAARR